MFKSFPTHYIYLLVPLLAATGLISANYWLESRQDKVAYYDFSNEPETVVAYDDDEPTEGEGEGEGEDEDPDEDEDDVSVDRLVVHPQTYVVHFSADNHRENEAGHIHAAAGMTFVWSNAQLWNRRIYEMQE